MANNERERKNSEQEQSEIILTEHFNGFISYVETEIEPKIAVPTPVELTTDSESDQGNVTVFNRFRQVIPEVVRAVITHAQHLNFPSNLLESLINYKNDSVKIEKQLLLFSTAVYLKKTNQLELLKAEVEKITKNIYAVYQDAQLVRNFEDKDLTIGERGTGLQDAIDAIKNHREFIRANDDAERSTIGALGLSFLRRSLRFLSEDLLRVHRVVTSPEMDVAGRISNRVALWFMERPWLAAFLPKSPVNKYYLQHFFVFCENSDVQDMIGKDAKQIFFDRIGQNDIDILIEYWRDLIALSELFTEDEDCELIYQLYHLEADPEGYLADNTLSKLEELKFKAIKSKRSKDIKLSPLIRL